MTGQDWDIDPSEFSFDPKTGSVTYLVTGSPYCGFYKGRWISKHRIIWRLHTGQWPEQVLDHVNGDRSDDRIVNLRDVSQAENMKNLKRAKNNSSGVTGVYWRKDVDRWQARICSDGKQTSLGYYEDFDAAVAARKNAEMRLGFHPNHGEQR